MLAKNIFQAATLHSEWLAHRRTAIASNVANANTPGYQVRDIASFSLELAAADASIVLSSTHTRHQQLAVNSAAAAEGEDGVSREGHHSGNNVNLDEEMMKAGQVAQQSALNAGVVRAFHRLLLTSTKA